MADPDTETALLQAVAKRRAAARTPHDDRLEWLFVIGGIAITAFLVIAIDQVMRGFFIG